MSYYFIMDMQATDTHLYAAQAAKAICKILKNSGYTAYFAGGYVRDLLLGIASADVDIATDALPDEIIALFPDYISVGAQFGVIIVKLHGYQFEVATFRSDLAYENGRRPTAVILKSTPQEDAKRRDFTINGMFLDPDTGQVIDFVNGQTDLQRKIIRTIGNPEERFTEDRLRMLRAIRFHNRFGFEIENNTQGAIKQLGSTLIPAVSVERIYMEFNKIHKSGTLSAALLKMHELTLLQAIFPSLEGVSLHEMGHRLREIGPLEKAVPVILILALMLKEDSRLMEIIDFFKGSHEDRQWIAAYLDVKKKFASTDTSDFDWAKIFAGDKTGKALELLSLQKEADWRVFCSTKQKMLAPHIDRLRMKSPLVRAIDLQHLGIKPGVIMGKLLREAERLSINRNIDDKTALITILKELYEDDFKHT